MLENDILPVYISIFENLRQNCRAGVDFTFTVYSYKMSTAKYFTPDNTHYTL